VAGLHGPSDDGDQIGTQRLKICLIAEPAPELLDGASGIEFAPVKASVDLALNSPAQRAEKGSHGES
jgi:hypothetical protein